MRLEINHVCKKKITMISVSSHIFLLNNRKHTHTHTDQKIKKNTKLTQNSHITKHTYTHALKHADSPRQKRIKCLFMAYWPPAGHVSQKKKDFVII